MKRLSVLTMPQTPTTANVIANGRLVATLHHIDPGVEWVGFDGQTRTGPRWMPVDVPAHVCGPATMNEAALLALALAGYDHEQSIRAVGLTNPAGKNGAAA